MLHLYIIRHAKASSNSNSGRDVDRPLNSKGLNQLQNLHIYLAKNKPIISEINVSSAKRTRETYKGLKNLLDSTVLFKDELYLASRDELNKLISNFNNNRPVMIIGHNDGLSDLVSYYVGDHIQLPTCAYIHLEFDLESWDLVSIDTAKIADSYFPSGD